MNDPHVNCQLDEIELVPGEYVLGLDVGSNSVGWALVDAQRQRIAAGVRVFSEGTTKVTGGKEESSATGRRLARQQRRQLDRRARRRKKVAAILFEHGLLPAPDDHAARLALPDPYLVRAKALFQPLDLHEIGRAFYHLGKRRGFRSSLKGAGGKEDEKELGKVKEGIASLESEIADAGKSSLGAYLASLDPQQQRIRGRYLSRQMIREEFEAIWNAQQPYHPATLTPELHDELDDAIFRQRDLKSQKALIGKCRYEPEFPRAPRACWLSHTVRVLQELNNLRIIDDDGRVRELNMRERATAHDKLMTQKSDVTFKALHKALKLRPDEHFNLEEGDREKINTHIVEAHLRDLFKEVWDAHADRVRFDIWDAFVDLEDDAFEQEAHRNGWSLTAEQLKGMASLYKLAGDGHGSLSREAIRKLVPGLERGLSLYDAAVEVYPEKTQPAALDRLPAITEDDGITNPVVRRSLSETRKVVNAIIARHGKPARIVVELAREAKGSIKDRNKRVAEMRDNERDRTRIKKALADAGIHPTSLQIRKFRLWEECKRECPYTGRPISFEHLFGPHPEFDIEHILPYSRAFDNSMANVTLCDSTENRLRKHNKTPWEAYGSDSERWEQIRQRVWHSLMPTHKKRRFGWKEIPDDFKARQLTDTSYAARELRQRLRLLGVPVDTTKGPVVAELRHHLGINGVLPQPEDAEGDPRKMRNDHRHHAIDAIAIALVDDRIRHHLSQRYDSLDERFRIERPWPTFFEDCKRAIERIHVSFRPERRLAGGFAKETNYGRRNIPGVGNDLYVHRMDLTQCQKLTPDTLKSICDGVVRETLRTHLRTLGLDPDAKEVNLPKGWYEGLRMPCRKGDGPPIRSVRVWERRSSVIAIPTDNPTRFVAPDNNHHLAFYRTRNRRGETTFVPELCTRFEALRRHAAGEPIIRPALADDPESPCVLWLMKGDTVLYLGDDDVERLYTVQNMSGPPSSPGLDFSLRLHTDALRVKKTPPECVRIKSVKTTQDGHLRLHKVTVDPIGRIYPLNDAPNHRSQRT